jgi:integrase
VASLQARHQRECGIVAARPRKTKADGTLRNPDQWTKFADAAEGCTCKPMYHIASSLPGGKLERRPVGHNRKEAGVALRAVQVEQDRGEYRPLRAVTFTSWWDEWMAGLRRPKESTKKSYISTGTYARKAFGHKKVRTLDVRDVEKFLDLMVRTVKRDGKIVTEPIAASTMAKHLRVLSACLSSAVKRGNAGRNPVDFLDDSHRPHPTRREAPYFTDDEIPLLLAAALPADRPLFKFALQTGLREGELFGLTWARVNLLEGEAYVREQFSGGETGAPKSQRSQRTVELPAEAVELLGAVWAEQGKPDGDVLVFPGSAGPRHFKTALNRLYKAMADAGIPRSGEHLEPPTAALRTFHSLRHSYARIALENGVELTWLSRQLGHSSAAFTEQRYGHWGAKGRKKQMAKLAEAEAFAF